MDIKDLFRHDDTQNAMHDFRLNEISEIINVVINKDNNPILSGIIDKWKDFIGYDGCVYIAMLSFFTMNKYPILIDVDSESLSKIMKDAYVEGVQPETFEITSICIIYTVSKDMVIHMPWLKNNEKFIIPRILHWANKYIKIIKKHYGFESAAQIIHNICYTEIKTRESMRKYMSNNYGTIVDKNIDINDYD